jgi:hypothetical protein
MSIAQGRKRRGAIKLSRHTSERRKGRIPFYKERRKDTYVYDYELEYLAEALGCSKKQLKRRIEENVEDR